MWKSVGKCSANGLILCAKIHVRIKMRFDSHSFVTKFVSRMHETFSGLGPGAVNCSEDDFGILEIHFKNGSS